MLNAKKVLDEEVKSKAKTLEVSEVKSKKLDDKKLGSVVRKAKGKDNQCKAVKVEIPEFKMRNLKENKQRVDG